MAKKTFGAGATKSGVLNNEVDIPEQTVQEEPTEEQPVVEEPTVEETPEVIETAEETQLTRGYINVDSANVREGPTTESKVITTLLLNTGVKILEQEGKETISIGDAAIQNAPLAKDFQIAFKKRPSEMNKIERGRMVAFMKGVYAEILHCGEG